MAGTKRGRPPLTLVQGFILVSLIGIIGVGMFYAGKNPDTQWGPIIIGAMGLLGLIVRGLFKVPEDREDDGYGTG